MGVRPGAEPEAVAATFALGIGALTGPGLAGSESTGAAAGSEAGQGGSVGITVSTVGAVAAAGGGGEDLGVSPAGGDALTSSTGLFYKSRDKETLADGRKGSTALMKTLPEFLSPQTDPVEFLINK